MLMPSCFKVFSLSSMFSYLYMYITYTPMMVCSVYDVLYVCCYECVTIPVTLWSVVPSLLRVCGRSGSNL